MAYFTDIAMVILNKYLSGNDIERISPALNYVIKEFRLKV
jgi:hypothetical protein